MKIGIFGGTFDPFTIAHKEIVMKVLADKLVDKVIVAPSIVDYYRKDKEAWLCHSDRLKVIEDALLDEIGLRQVDIWTKDYEFAERFGADCEAVKSFRFYHTLIRILADEKYEKAEPYIIVGWDEYKSLADSKWYNSKEIFNLAHIIAVKRGSLSPRDIPVVGYPHSPTVVIIDDWLGAVSATKIRNEYKGRPLSEYYKRFGDPIEMEKLIAKTPIFDLVRKHAAEEGFCPVMIKSKDWATIIVEKDGKFLMVTQKRHGVDLLSEEFPCGTVELGENPLDAVIRELEEETGYIIMNKSCVRSLGVYNPNPAFMNNKMHYFYVNLDECMHVVGAVKFDEHEHITSHMVPCEDVVSRAFSTTYDESMARPVMMAFAAALYMNFKLKERK